MSDSILAELTARLQPNDQYGRLQLTPTTLRFATGHRPFSRTLWEHPLDHIHVIDAHPGPTIYSPFTLILTTSHGTIHQLTIDRNTHGTLSLYDTEAYVHTFLDALDDLPAAPTVTLHPSPPPTPTSRVPCLAIMVIALLIYLFMYLATSQYPF